MNSTTWAVGGRAPSRKSTRRLEDLVSAAQLADLPLQLGDTPRILTGRSRPRSRIHLGLADPVTQGLPIDPQLRGDTSDRPLATPRLTLNLQHHPHSPLTQLVWILPRCRHDSLPSQVSESPRNRGRFRWRGRPVQR